MPTGKVKLEEILGLQRYEEIRPAFRSKIIELKRHRRISIGDIVTLVFENHDTMLFQIQEMLRAERIVDIDRVRDELGVYNQLVPEAGELSATLLIEITDSDRIRERLMSLTGIDEAVRLEIGSRQLAGQFEPGRSTLEKVSAVQYVRFKFDADATQAFIDGNEPIRIVIDHAHYRHTTVVEPAVRRALARDLQ